MTRSDVAAHRVRAITRVRHFVRALRLRCPLCGRPWRRADGLRLARRCRACQLDLERHENDSFLGAYTVNLFATLFVATLTVVAVVRWYGAPVVLRYGAAFLAIAAFALGFYPISKLLWLAIDLQFRPPVEKDFDDRSTE